MAAALVEAWAVKRWNGEDTSPGDIDRELAGRENCRGRRRQERRRRCACCRAALATSMTVRGFALCVPCIHDWGLWPVYSEALERRLP